MHGKNPTDPPTHGEIKRRLYDSVEVRELLGGLSESTFRRMCRNEEIKTVKQGSRVYVEADELDAYIERLRSAA